MPHYCACGEFRSYRAKMCFTCHNKKHGRTVERDQPMPLEIDVTRRYMRVGDVSHAVYEHQDGCSVFICGMFYRGGTVYHCKDGKVRDKCEACARSLGRSMTFKENARRAEHVQSEVRPVKTRGSRKQFRTGRY